MLREPAQLIGQSPAFLTLLEHVSRVAPLDRPVLVVGERGTGKELIAARLHFLSAAWEGPFVKLNCAAVSETLIEAELFGHEAGAFTGAVRRRAGRFERAHGGTLFLDEIANASLAVQEKILRVIEYGEFERLGSAETIRVDVRVIGATNLDLPAAADAGRFRHDLLDRLSFDVLTLPPLRVRHGDVPLLASHTGRAMAHEVGWTGYPGFSKAALKRLQDHAWPGNVRELRNVVERAVAHWPDPEAAIEHFELDPFASPYRPAGPVVAETAGLRPGPVETPPATRPRPEAGLPFDFRTVVAEFEKDLLGRALAANRFNQRATARHLGLSYHQLRNDLRRHDLLGTAG